LAIFIPRHAAVEWAIKAEPWLLLLSALGLWAACRLPRWRAACVIAIAGAMLVDMKATILLVALLPCVLLWQRERSARVPAAVCAFILIPLLAILPFALPGVSIGNYLQILLGYQKHPVLVANLLRNAQMTARKSLKMAVEQTLYVLPDETQVSARDTENDLLAISRRYPGKTMQMGYSDYAHYNLTFVRPVLQIQGNPLFLDAITRTEKNFIGEHESPELVDALARCTIQLWVIPKGGAPFSLEDLYYYFSTATDKSGMDPELYHESFRQTFLTHYEKIQQPSRYFDVWACRTPVIGSPTIQ